MPLVPNLPTPEGREAGTHLARLSDAAEAMITNFFGELPPQCVRCVDCACRAGTDPNGSPQTVVDFLECVRDKEPFYCHLGIAEGSEPKRICGGWFMAMVDLQSAATPPPAEEGE